VSLQHQNGCCTGHLCHNLPPRVKQMFTTVNINYNISNKGLVPHSQCSRRENHKFLQNYQSKNITVWEKFCIILLFNICHCNWGLAFKSKNYYIAAQNYMYFKRENSHKLRQKCLWALWMRHQFWKKRHAKMAFSDYNTLHSVCY
jgi:hypothetical protein